MKPREINPECIDDDAFWDIEALKLAVIDPETYVCYATLSHQPNDGKGSTGLDVLGFLVDDEYVPAFDGKIFRPFNQARIANFGHQLVWACGRVYVPT